MEVLRRDGALAVEQHGAGSGPDTGRPQKGPVGKNGRVEIGVTRPEPDGGQKRAQNGASEGGLAVAVRAVAGIAIAAGFG